MAARRLAVAAVALSLLGVVIAAGRSHPPDLATTSCSAPGARGALAAGTGMARVTHNGMIVRGSRACPLDRLAPGGVVLRHVTQSPGVGSAFVEDLAGPDRVVTVTAAGTERFAAGGNAVNPTWSPDGRLAWALDLSALNLWRPGSSSVTVVPAPRGSSALFAPAWVSSTRIVAVSQEPVPGVPLEDEGLDNLWRFDLTTRRWGRLTSFDVTGTRWSALRTPLVDAAGDLLFVRVHGDYTAAREPSFELWKLQGSRARKIASLPGEMYLAGWDRGRLVYNVPDASCGGWALVRESQGGLERTGCGATLVDPAGAIDPDATDPAEEAPPAGDVEQSVATVVVIGDFASRARALKAERGLPDAPGLTVVGHREAPLAVAPGAWAVLRPVAATERPASVARALKVWAPKLAPKVFLAPAGR